MPRREIDLLISWQSLIAGALTHVLVWVSVASLYGCSEESQDSNSVDPSYPSIQAQIFDRSCTFSSCHRGSNPPNGLALTADLAYENLVNAQAQDGNSVRVKPSDPEGSLLIHVLEGTSANVERMPLGSAALPEHEILAIRQWISSGAQR